MVGETFLCLNTAFRCVAGSPFQPLRERIRLDPCIEKPNPEDIDDVLVGEERTVLAKVYILPWWVIPLCVIPLVILAVLVFVWVSMKR
jgi:hypothetical protein